jgi:hypothetical protein
MVLVIVVYQVKVVMCWNSDADGAVVKVTVLGELLPCADVEVYTVMPLGHVRHGFETVTVVGSRSVVCSVVVCSASMVSVVIIVNDCSS